MTRETRLNLIFIVTLLALTLPGGVIMFRKKLAREAVRSNSLPDPVPRSVAYMSPAETPPGMSRVNPPRTAAWCDGLVRQFGGDGAVRPSTFEGLPVMSSGRGFEMLCLRQDREEIHVLLLGWNKSLTSPESGWTSPAGAVRVVRSEEVPIPEPVREELGVNGMLVPPKRLLVQEVALPRVEKVTELTLDGQKGTRESLKIVPSFTKPVAANNYGK